ncbi:hypothetical protein H4R34_000885 [Dimargaris verticillata]|uniref:Nucleoporin Nup159/Nup146 N-terminal domain-containing protein n=1 Tax=Dimargaris verticillata TaxID=2761393 RepID=A0A9W8BAX4_9FUNG|nr:hypothetical protein H4R34_000885 [Dimargaris verticillata]
MAARQQTLTLKEADVEGFRPTEITTSTLIRLSDPFALDETPGYCSLLAVASDKGYVVAGTTQGFVVVGTLALHVYWASAKKNDTVALSDTTPHVSIKVPQGRVQHVAVSSDQQSILVGLHTGAVLVYSATNLKPTATPERTLLPDATVGLKQVSIRDLAPNPSAFPECVAILYTTGHLRLVNFRTGQGIGAGPGQQTTTIAWSRMGKGLLAGQFNGQLLTIDSNGSITKTIPAPPTTVAPGHTHLVVHVRWLINLEALAVYEDYAQPAAAYLRNYVTDPAPKEEEPSHEYTTQIVRWTKDSPPSVTYSTADMVCCPLGMRMREEKFYTAALRQWGSQTKNIVLMASTASTDVSVLGQIVPDAQHSSPAHGWQMWTLNESYSMTLPLASGDDDDTSPVGLALDLSSTIELPPVDPDNGDPNAPGTKATPPVPILLVYNTDGTLDGYFMVYADAIGKGVPYPGMCAHPESFTVGTDLGFAASTPQPFAKNTTGFSGFGSAPAANRVQPPKPSPFVLSTPAPRAPPASKLAPSSTGFGLTTPQLSLNPPALADYQTRTTVNPKPITVTVPPLPPPSPSPPPEPTPEDILRSTFVHIYTDFNAELKQLVNHVHKASQGMQHLKTLSDTQRAVDPCPSQPPRDANYPTLYSTDNIVKTEFTHNERLREATNQLLQATHRVNQEAQASRHTLLDLQSDVLKLETQRCQAKKDMRYFVSRTPGLPQVAFSPPTSPPLPGHQSGLDYNAEARQQLHDIYDDVASGIRRVETSLRFLQQFAGRTGAPNPHHSGFTVPHHLQSMIRRASQQVQARSTELRALEAQLARLELEPPGSLPMASPASPGESFTATSHLLGQRTPRTQPGLNGAHAASGRTLASSSPSRPWRQTLRTPQGTPKPAVPSTPLPWDQSPAAVPYAGAHHNTTPLPPVGPAPRRWRTADASSVAPAVSADEVAPPTHTRPTTHGLPPLDSAMTHLHQRAYQLQYHLTRAGLAPTARREPIHVTTCPKPGAPPASDAMASTPKKSVEQVLSANTPYLVSEAFKQRFAVPAYDDIMSSESEVDEAFKDEKESAEQREERPAEQSLALAALKSVKTLEIVQRAELNKMGYYTPQPMRPTATSGMSQASPFGLGKPGLVGPPATVIFRPPPLASPFSTPSASPLDRKSTSLGLGPTLSHDAATMSTSRKSVETTGTAVVSHSALGTGAALSQPSPLATVITTGTTTTTTTVSSDGEARQIASSVTSRPSTSTSSTFAEPTPFTNFATAAIANSAVSTDFDESSELESNLDSDSDSNTSSSAEADLDDHLVDSQFEVPSEDQGSTADDDADGVASSTPSLRLSSVELSKPDVASDGRVSPKPTLQSGVVERAVTTPTALIGDQEEQQVPDASSPSPKLEPEPIPKGVEPLPASTQVPHDILQPVDSTPPSPQPKTADAPREASPIASVPSSPALAAVVSSNADQASSSEASGSTPASPQPTPQRASRETTPVPPVLLSPASPAVKPDRVASPEAHGSDSDAHADAKCNAEKPVEVNPDYISKDESSSESELGLELGSESEVEFDSHPAEPVSDKEKEEAEGDGVGKAITPGVATNYDKMTASGDQSMPQQLKDQSRSSSYEFINHPAGKEAGTGEGSTPVSPERVAPTTATLALLPKAADVVLSELDDKSEDEESATPVEERRLDQLAMDNEVLDENEEDVADDEGVVPERDDDFAMASDATPPVGTAQLPNLDQVVADGSTDMAEEDPPFGLLGNMGMTSSSSIGMPMGGIQAPFANQSMVGPFSAQLSALDPSVQAGPESDDGMMGSDDEGLPLYLDSRPSASRASLGSSCDDIHSMMGGLTATALAQNATSHGSGAFGTPAKSSMPAAFAGAESESSSGPFGPQNMHRPATPADGGNTNASNLFQGSLWTPNSRQPSAWDSTPTNHTNFGSTAGVNAFGALPLSGQGGNPGTGAVNAFGSLTSSPPSSTSPRSVTAPTQPVFGQSNFGQSGFGAVQNPQATPTRSTSSGAFGSNAPMRGGGFGSYASGSSSFSAFDSSKK